MPPSLHGTDAEGKLGRSVLGVSFGFCFGRASVPLGSALLCSWRCLARRPTTPCWTRCLLWERRPTSLKTRWSATARDEGWCRASGSLLDLWVDPSHPGCWSSSSLKWCLIKFNVFNQMWHKWRWSNTDLLHFVLVTDRLHCFFPFVLD